MSDEQKTEPEEFPLDTFNADPEYHMDVTDHRAEEPEVEPISDETMPPCEHSADGIRPCWFCFQDKIRAQAAEIETLKASPVEGLVEIDADGKVHPVDDLATLRTKLAEATERGDSRHAAWQDAVGFKQKAEIGEEEALAENATLRTQLAEAREEIASRKAELARIAHVVDPHGADIEERAAERFVLAQQQRAEQAESASASLQSRVEEAERVLGNGEGLPDGCDDTYAERAGCALGILRAALAAPPQPQGEKTFGRSLCTEHQSADLYEWGCPLCHVASLRLALDAAQGIDQGAIHGAPPQGSEEEET